MKKSGRVGKYWHELTPEEKKYLRDSGATVGWLVENIKQPPWCSYSKALMCQMGCWSLMSDKYEISEEFCGSGKCGYFVPEEKRHGYGGYTTKKEVQPDTGT